MTRDRSPQVQVRFRRDLGLLQVTMIGLGPTIGTTVFLLIGPGFEIAAGALLLALVLNLGVTALTAVAYAELASSIPEAGGGYLWIKTAMKEPWGFIGGWMSWFGHCVACALYVMSFGIFAALFLQHQGVLPPGDVTSVLLPARAIALPLLGIFLVINYRGTKAAGHSGSAVTIVLLAVVAALVIFGLAWFFGHAGDPVVQANLSVIFRGTSLVDNALNVLVAMGLTFVVFEGYEIIAQTGEETKDPGKIIPRATGLTLGIATVIFLTVGFLTLAATGTTFGPGTVCSDPAFVGSDPEFAVACASQVFLGPGLGLFLVTTGVALGSLAALNSLVFSSSRVAFAMGRDGALPRVFGTLHPKNRTPHIAVITSGIVIAGMISFLDLIQIAASADVMFLLLFLLVNWSAIVLRRKLPDIPRPYRMPLFPVIPLMGMATMGLLAVGLFLLPGAGPLAWALGGAWVAIGLAIHYLWAKKERIVEVGKVAVEALVPLTDRPYKILVPIEDFSDRSLVEFAALVAKVEDADLQLLHVIEVPDSLPVDAIEGTYVSEVRRDLAKLGAVARELDVEARATAMVSHHVTEAILEVVREEEMDLLVLGWRGGSRRGRILGSNVDRFVQYSPSDVTVFKTAAMPEKLSSIVVMNAPEWHVSYATGYAMMLAKRHKAKIVIFTAATTEAEMAKERIYSARLALLCRNGGVPVEEKFAQVRSIADAVVQEAQHHDLLVLGATGEWSLLQNAFGADQDAIARRVPGPVLMVRKVTRKSA